MDDNEARFSIMSSLSWDYYLEIMIRTIICRSGLVKFRANKQGAHTFILLKNNIILLVSLRISRWIFYRTLKHAAKFRIRNE